MAQDGANDAYQRQMLQYQQQMYMYQQQAYAHQQRAQQTPEQVKATQAQEKESKLAAQQAEQVAQAQRLAHQAASGNAADKEAKSDKAQQQHQQYPTQYHTQQWPAYGAKAGGGAKGAPKGGPYGMGTGQMPASSSQTYPMGKGSPGKGFPGGPPKGKGGKGSQLMMDPNWKGKKLFVGGLHGAVTRDQLWQYFAQYGSVKEVVLALDKNGQPKYFGFVKFATADDARNTCMQPHTIMGRWIDVKPYDDGNEPQQAPEKKGKGDGERVGRDRSTSSGRSFRGRSPSRSRSPAGRSRGRAGRSRGRSRGRGGRRGRSRSGGRSSSPRRRRRSPSSPSRPRRPRSRSGSARSGSRRRSSPTSPKNNNARAPAGDRNERNQGERNKSPRRGAGDGRMDTSGGASKTRTISKEEVPQKTSTTAEKNLDEESESERRRKEERDKAGGAGGDGRSRSRSARSPRRSRSRSGGRSRSRSKGSAASGRSYDSRSRSKSAASKSSENARVKFRQRQGDIIDAASADATVDVKVEGTGSAPEPVKSWEDAVERKLMPEKLMEILKREGMVRPTVVQRYCIAMAQDRSRDLICSAQTGSGKTFAFVIPTVCSLFSQGEVFRPWFPGQLTQGSPLILCLSPTRELAIQTDREVASLFKNTPFNSLCIYGGEPLPIQLARMTKQVDFLCGTPGRVMDLVDQARLSLNYVQTLVIDEADQMFDLGMEKIVLDLIFGRDLPTQRQTLLFSATFPPSIQELCKSTLRAVDPKHPATTGHWTVKVGKYDASSKGGGSVENITQIVHFASQESQKEAFLMRDVGLHITEASKCIVFTNRRRYAEALQLRLEVAFPNLNIRHLHGKLEQWAREEIVTAFDKNECHVLLASNVASRGLDFPDVKLVVQFDMAENITVYTHRIGRTGRCGNDGTSITYFTRKDRELAQPLASFLRLNKQAVPDFLTHMR